MIFISGGLGFLLFERSTLAATSSLTLRLVLQKEAASLGYRFHSVNLKGFPKNFSEYKARGFQEQANPEQWVPRSGHSHRAVSGLAGESRGSNSLLRGQT